MADRRWWALCLAAGCHATVVSPPPAVGPAPTRDDCPREPAIELHALRGEGVGEGFPVGGHVTTLEPVRDEEGGAWIVGTLDVKGTQHFEARTRALALVTYRAGLTGDEPARMGLALHGRVVASLEVRSTMRGGRFRLRLHDESAATRDELEQALAVDRRCFPGR